MTQFSRRGRLRPYLRESEDYEVNQRLSDVNTYSGMVKLGLVQSYIESTKHLSRDSHLTDRIRRGMPERFSRIRGSPGAESPGSAKGRSNTDLNVPPSAFLRTAHL